ncbi:MULTISPECIES: TrkH family potassium uptake protein [Bacillaceae]|uniref:TrkH family potassium uptake protein n=1 Tax=Anaerobacillus sp. 1_MG-2023 TaxID=3062655 RepID=UPI0024B3B89C|nr:MULTISPECIES: TrkH family potassium uptake protein [Bacillaceae]MDO6656752.1 TrkH family potassium uptake protein [Anaerobacillus sp. 1_MG-2023]
MDALLRSRFRRIRLTSVQLIVLFYLIAVTVSTFLIGLPIAHQPGVQLSFIDALFTAVSAVSVTGLSVVSISDTFSVPGIFILAAVLQIGGIGIMTLGTFVWLVMGKKIGLKERQLIMTDQNQSTLSGLVQLMKQILGLIFIIELVGALVLGTYYLRFFETWQEAYLQGFFAAVSATTNGGFDITGSSLQPFAHDYFVQFIHILLIITGAIGFPVLIEVKNFLFARQNSHRYKFSLFTKLTTMTFFVLVVSGAILIWAFEANSFFAGKNWHESFFYAMFQSVTTRSGGLSTMDVNQFQEPTQLLMSALMFIGASPSSVGGGVRTTTFAIVLLAIFFFAKGGTSIKVFGRELHHEDIHKAFVVFTVAIIVWSCGIIMLSFSEPYPIVAIIFEVSSAFGTTGLSMGVTPGLSTFGKIVIMCLMFIGRIGILSFLFLIRGTVLRERYHYPTERVIIG